MTGSPAGPMTGDVIDRRPCPACNATVTQTYRPGRARVYCNQACRQHAYRRRRDAGVRWFTERDGPTTRSSTHDRRHALRHPDDDPAARLTDHRERALTACGTFARPSTYDRTTHTEFLPNHPWSCHTCITLTGADDLTTDPPLLPPSALANLTDQNIAGLRFRRLVA